MSETVQANDGTMLPLSSLAQTITYDGTIVETVTVNYPGNKGTVYKQTMTNDGTNITSVSGWEVQP